MFIPRMIRATSLPLSRSYGSTGPACCMPLAVREVMVSQSRDLPRNMALEDWVVRKIDLSTKNILVLTNNLSVCPRDLPVLDIRATLMDTAVIEKAAEFEELVLGSLPPSLGLAAIPELGRGRALLEEGALTHTVRLQLHSTVKAKEVLEALHNIAKTFLKDQGQKRLSLVRPDDGWFEGLEPVRSDLDGRLTQSLRQLARREKEEVLGSRRLVRGRQPTLQDSYGH